MLRIGRLFALASMLVCLAAAAATAQDAVPLALKYSVGDVLEYEVTLSGSGGLRAPDGQFSPAGVKGNLWVTMTVAEVKPDGSARVQLLIPRADLQVNVGEQRGRFSYENGNMRWFSNGREQAPPDADLSKMPILSVPVEFVAAANGRILDVIMPNVPGMTNLQQVAPGLGAPQMRNVGDAIFPDAPVKVGETWRKYAQVAPFGPSMPPITVSSSRTLDSVSNEGGVQLARISGYVESRFRSNPVTVSPGGTTMTVAVPDLRETVTSTEFFDIGAGRLVRGEYDLSFMLRASVGSGAQTQEGSVEARLQATVHAR